MRSKLRIAAAMMILVGAARASADGVAVVELFTSEGCSSCPPADRVLAELNRAARDQHDSNTIALSWHVDYWDRLGWKDPYSSPENSQRQVEMARDANGGRVYTPQAIVNGRATLVGSRRQQLTETIATARSNDHVASLEVKADSPADGTVTVHWKLPDSVQERSFRVEVLLTEDQLVSSVTRGENAGSTLSHDAVVRSSTQLAPGIPLGTATLTPPEGFVYTNGSAVVLVRRLDSYAIIAAGKVEITRPPSP